MSTDIRTDELEIASLVPEEPAARPSPTTTSSGNAFVVILVCLGVWAVLLAPSLLRSAEAGPVGTRRAVALALLRPLAAVAEGLAVDRAADGFERTLGRDPDLQPGGELELPSIELPTMAVQPPPTPGRSGHGGTTAPVEGDVPSTPLAPPSPEPPDVSIRTPAPEAPLRVAVVGDSLSQGLGPAVVELFDPDLARVLPLGRQSTGLARLDYFNWRAGMRELVEGFRPDLVFVMLGSNDNQAQIGPDGTEIEVGSTAWVDAYRERADRFLQEATSAGTHVVWVGIPIVEERWRWDFYRRVNDIYRETAEADPFATYVDAWSLLQMKAGGYTAYLRNERGQLEEMRAGDGIHFTPTGYGYLARLAVRAAADAFDLAQRAVTFRI